MVVFWFGFFCGCFLLFVVLVFVFSGVSLVLPPTRVLICAAGLTSRNPYWLAETPAAAHCAGVRPELTKPVFGVIGPQHRSAVPPAPTVAGWNSSLMFGARTARL